MVMDEIENYVITTLFLSDDNRLEPVFQYSSILILRIRQQDDNLGTIFQHRTKTHTFVIGKGTLGKRQAGFPFREQSLFKKGVSDENFSFIENTSEFKD